MSLFCHINKWLTTPITFTIAWDELDEITKHTSERKLQTVPPSVAGIVSIIRFRSKFALKTYSKGKKEMESNGKNNSDDITHIDLKTINDYSIYSEMFLF